MNGMMLTRKKKKIFKGKLVPVPLDHHQSQMEWPGIEPDLVDERLETNHLSHRMAPVQCRCYIFSMMIQH